MDHFIGFMVFWVYGAVCSVFGAGYYHFAWGVGKTNRELAEAKEKLAALEKHGAKTEQIAA